MRLPWLPWRLAALLFPLIEGETAASAAGGAHVVDDADVETPGLCHLESWVTSFTRGAGLLNAAPACTRRDLPNLEIGGAITHGWSRSGSDTVLGPAAKLKLRSVDRGLGVAVLTSAGWSLGAERLETAAVLLPMTARLGSATRVNLNSGWLYAATGDRHALFMGAQLERQVGRTVSAMVELFGRDRGRPGFQAGLRWTPRDWVDLDLLAGARPDGTSPKALTLGVTVRR